LGKNQNLASTKTLELLRLMAIVLPGTAKYYAKINFAVVVITGC